MNICNLIKNKIIAAPIAGISDKAYRIIMKKHGCPLTFTEMISAKGLYYNSANTAALLDIRDEPGSVICQLFGSEPDIIAWAIKHLSDHGFAGFDINMGCPAQKIVKNGEGSALMKSPDLVAQIVDSAKSATDLPVSVKIRKGWDENSVNAVTIAKIAEQNGANWVTVHGRTRSQQYAGLADRSIIRDVAAALTIPVIANGDVKSQNDNIIEETGSHAAMAARATIGNPWLFSGVEPTLHERIETAIHHLHLAAGQKGELTAVREMRPQLSAYIKGIKGASELRTKLVRLDKIAEIENCLKIAITSM